MNIDNESIFSAKTDAIFANMNNVSSLVGHPGSIGDDRESILRKQIAEHVPRSMTVGTGFIRTGNHESTQIDILIYDNAKPVLADNGKIVIVTPDAVRGIIEIRTAAGEGGFEADLKKLADNIAMIPQNPAANRFFGAFYYEGAANNFHHGTAINLLDALASSADHNPQRVINCLSVGRSFFSRFWIRHPIGNQLTNSWHGYRLENKAPVYFVRNIVDHLCPESIAENVDAWFIQGGKEKDLEMVRPLYE